MEQLFFDFLINFFASVAVIMFFYWLLQPKLLISDKIAKENNDSGKPIYTFKIVNITSYPIIDIRIEIDKCTPKNNANFQVNDIDEIGTVDKFILDSPKKLSEPNGNEFYFNCDNLEADWDDSKSHIRVQVIARHSLSQFSKVFVQKYHYKKSCVVEGRFESGRSVAVQ